MQLRKIRSLDAATAAVDAGGLRHFHWPLAWAEQRTFVTRLIEGYATLSRMLQDKGDEDGDLLAILAMEFVQEALRGWYVATVMARFQDRGEDISASWLNGGSAEDAAFWRPRRDRIGFLRGRFPPSTWRSLLRPFYGLTQSDGLSWRWPQFTDFRSRIIATNPDPLTTAHARAAGETPVLVSLRYWFGEASDTIPSDLSTWKLRRQTADAILAAFTEACRDAGSTAPAALLTHLNAWLNEATAICRWYLRALIAAPHKLPAQLWTGSGGYIFRRILHVAVRRAGGKTVSHDHGSGLGLFDFIDTNLTEFVTPDTFFTFSRIQAEGYRTQRNNRFRLRAQWPEIDHVTGNSAALTPAAPRPGKPQRILFVANQYRGDKVTITPIEYDLVAVDWQSRLFAQLRGLGYEVLLRAHPDSVSPPPASMKEIGVQNATGTFDVALASADAVILDYLHSSVLCDVLLSGKPVMTFEFGHCPPNAVTKGALARRIRFISGSYDDTNRAQTDWSALPRAIDEARAMAGDTAFVDLFAS